MADHSENIQRRATLGGAEGDPAGSSSAISGYTASELGQFVNVHSSIGELSTAAQPRARQGPFFDVDDLLRYFNEGNLLLYDTGGDPVVNPILHLVSRYDDDYESDVYDVYIDEDST